MDPALATTDTPTGRHSLPWSPTRRYRDLVMAPTPAPKHRAHLA